MTYNVNTTKTPTKMEYAIGLIQDRLDLLEAAYTMYVVNGTVPPSSESAINNINKQNQLKTAIEKLKRND